MLTKTIRLSYREPSNYTSSQGNLGSGRSHQFGGETTSGDSSRSDSGFGSCSTANEDELNSSSVTETQDKNFFIMYSMLLILPVRLVRER